MQFSKKPNIPEARDSIVNANARKELTYIHYAATCLKPIILSAFSDVKIGWRTISGLLAAIPANF